MDRTTELILATLAVYRISQLIAIDDGPYGVFKRARTYAGKKASSASMKDQWGFWRNVAELIHCPFCIGVWAALIAALSLSPKIDLSFLLLWWGIAGGAAFMEARNAE